MKTIYPSHSKTHSDPHLLSLTNRINFIQRRRNKIQAELKEKILTQIHNDTLDPEPHTLTLHQHEYQTNKPIRQSPKQKPNQHQNTKLLQIQQQKNSRYRQCKQNTERIMIKIRQKKEQQLNLKRLKRTEILISQHQARNKLQLFQQQKIKQIQLLQNNRAQLQEQLALKRIQIKQQLISEENKHIEQYEDLIIQKAALIGGISRYIRPEF